ncbi:hypothetical protein EZI54_06940 [Marinobacter halodurans]|uniref:Transmembrane protein n=1 Tax=Marinobacter halodurans TaxID=2528979 RepID=A0ABY1ZPP9_9GAMM|nr:hypothetical protein [Marinobacter halodurans]TBW57387.1 hypothetical protein EZI54_06940 [Marinobacter halodurans]
MMQFEPQQVESGSWRVWCREALALSARRPFAFIILTLVYSTLSSLPWVGDTLLMPMTPVFLGLGSRLARQADIDRPSSRALTGLSMRSLSNLVVVGLIPVAIVGVLTVILNALPIPKSEPSIADTLPALPWIPFEAGVGVLVAMMFWLILSGSLILTLPPLLAIADLPLRSAGSQALLALDRNFILLRLASACAGILFLLLFAAMAVGGIPAIAAFPFMSCLLYVCYRHIWWDRLQNEKLRAESNANEGAPAAA